MYNKPSCKAVASLALVKHQSVTMLLVCVHVSVTMLLVCVHVCVCMLVPVPNMRPCDNVLLEKSFIHLYDFLIYFCLNQYGPLINRLGLSSLMSP